MGKNKKRRKPRSKNEFEKPSKEDYERGKLGIYIIAGITIFTVIGLFYLYTVK